MRLPIIRWFGHGVDAFAPPGISASARGDQRCPDFDHFLGEVQKQNVPRSLRFIGNVQIRQLRGVVVVDLAPSTWQEPRKEEMKVQIKAISSKVGTALELASFTQIQDICPNRDLCGLVKVAPVPEPGNPSHYATELFYEFVLWVREDVTLHSHEGHFKAPRRLCRILAHFVLRQLLRSFFEVLRQALDAFHTLFTRRTRALGPKSVKCNYYTTD